MNSLVKQIVETEWALFDRVPNRGGRAACQGDRETFFLMRSSQLAAWSADVQESYLADLRAACRAERNLLTEKYGYMMERTCRGSSPRSGTGCPPRDPEKDRLIDGVCAVHVAWLEALAARYPHLAGRGRAIRREEDSPADTSFETYLWGELATYSMETLRRYAAYVVRLQKEGKNLNEMVLQNTAAQYGYGSLEEAEARLAGSRG